MNVLINIYKIMKKEDRFKAFYLFFLIIINVFLEMLGIGLIFPVLGFILSEKFFVEYSQYLNLLSNFFELNRQNLTIFFSVCLIVVFLIKNLIALYFSFYKYKFTYNLLNYFSEKIFLKYVNKDISYFSDTNSSVPIRNIDNVGIFTEGINQFLYILIDIIFFVSILVFLFYINIVNTVYLIIITFFSLYIFRKLTKKKIAELGSTRQYYLQKKIQNVIESMNAIKEIKIFFKEIFFFKKYKNFLNKYSNTSRLFETYQSAPRLLLEVLGVFSLSSILIINIISNQDSEIIISTIAIFGVSAIKILPSLSRILSSLQFLNHYLPVINTTVDELKIDLEQKNLLNFDGIEDAQVKKTLEFDKILEIKNLSFSYGKKKILNKINLEIKKNEIIGIIGKTGSGKSTLANLIAGILKAESGSIKIDYKLEIDQALKINQNLFGYIPQSTFLIDDTIKNNITFGEDDKKFDKNLFWECLKISRIDNYVMNLKDKENSFVGERGVKISGGQAQRIGIARALYRSPSIMLLDEATSSLDMETEKDFIKSINLVKNKYTMIIITHRIASLDICDRIYKIESGMLIPYKVD